VSLSQVGRYFPKKSKGAKQVKQAGQGLTGIIESQKENSLFHFKIFSLRFSPDVRKLPK